MNNEQYSALFKAWEAAKAAERFNWSRAARPEQRLPGVPFRIWLIRTGRGWGKTRTGSETVRGWVRDNAIVNIVGPTQDTLRDIMVEGESGILNVCPNDERPIYSPALRSLRWPNGSRSLLFSADEVERLRGQQSMKIWMDEIAAWRYPREAFDQLMFGLRLGTNPQAIITTTPKPTPFIKEISTAPTTYLTLGTTFDNRANLAEAFFSEVITKYQNTRIGRQELDAELLEEIEGALFHLSIIERFRVMSAPADLERVVIAIDPAGTSNANSDETGISVCGTDGKKFFVLGDYSMKGSPEAWAKRAVGAYHTFRADAIVGEGNFGGDMIESVIKNCDPNVNYRKVVASRGKQLRAEPISGLYEQGRVHHVGVFGDLESQMCEWSPAEKSYSPDRLDALVWALTELSGNSSVFGYLDWWKDFKAGLAGVFLRGPRPELNPRDQNTGKQKVFEAAKSQLTADEQLVMNPTGKAQWEPDPPGPCRNPEIQNCVGKMIEISGFYRCCQCAYQDWGSRRPPKIIFAGRNGFVERDARMK